MSSRTTGQAGRRVSATHGPFSTAQMDPLEPRTFLSAAPATPAALGETDTYKTHASVKGESLQEYTADWWQWFWSIKADVNPLFDPTGAQSFRGDVGKVFFLAGMGAPGSVTRTATIPTGTPVFFPVINTEWDNVGDPFTTFTADQLRQLAAANTEATTEIHASLDGQAIGGDLFGHREKSPVFSYTLPATGNVYQDIIGLDVTGTIDPAVSDGYWLMLKPLSPGHHTLNFGGATSNGFALDVTYDITVVPAGQYNHQASPQNAKAGKHDDNPLFSDRPITLLH